MAEKRTFPPSHTSGGGLLAQLRLYGAWTQFTSDGQRGDWYSVWQEYSWIRQECGGYPWKRPLRNPWQY